MLLNGPDELGFSIGVRSITGVARKAVNMTPAVALTRKAVTVVKQKIVGGAAASGPRPCGLFERIFVKLGSKTVRDCQLPSGEMAGMGDPPDPLRHYVNLTDSRPRGRLQPRAELAGLGFAPAVAAVALPAAQKYGPGLVKGVVSLFGGGGSKPPPPCTFGEKLNRLFGGKPACR